MFFTIGCDPIFDSTLREYIDNVEARNPLDFSLSSSLVINEALSFSMGFHIDEYTETCTITNNEMATIQLKAFPGVEGDFTISPIDAQVLGLNDSFSFSITYNPSLNPSSRVTEDILFMDVKRREFLFTVVGTSKRQPLVLYNNAEDNLTKFDLGNWVGEDRSVFLRNDALSELEITDIALPNGITYRNDSDFILDVGEEIELFLQYDGTRIITDENVEIHTTDNLENLFEFNISAGGDLNATITDIPVVDNIYDFGTSEISIPHTFTLTNNSTGDWELEASMDSTDFLTDITSSSLAAGKELGFQVIFASAGNSGSKSADLTIRNKITNRTKTITFVGVKP